MALKIFQQLKGFIYYCRLSCLWTSKVYPHIYSVLNIPAISLPCYRNTKSNLSVKHCTWNFVLDSYSSKLISHTNRRSKANQKSFNCKLFILQTVLTAFWSTSSSPTKWRRWTLLEQLCRQIINMVAFKQRVYCTLVNTKILWKLWDFLAIAKLPYYFQALLVWQFKPASTAFLIYTMHWKNLLKGGITAMIFP